MGKGIVLGLMALFLKFLLSVGDLTACGSADACEDGPLQASNLLQARRSLATMDSGEASLLPMEAADFDNLAAVFQRSMGATSRFGPGVTALLAELHNETSAEDLNPACKRRSAAGAEAQPARRSNDAFLKLKFKKAEANASYALSGTCAVGQLKLMDFSATGASHTCCPASSRACAGCASYSGTTCQHCRDGFVTRDGTCIACTSSAGWLSITGKSCFQLAAAECNDEKVRGQSSNEACCKCGGGVVTPTPFSYPNLRWALDSEISMKPEPRTAQRYTLDAACELAAHNLTMDSATGAISYISGRTKPTEAFSFECEVTAHQTAAISTTAVVVVAADILSYKSGVLLFHNGDVEEPVLTGNGWSNFQMACAPEISWLSMDASNGRLTYSGDTSAQGGLSVADDKFFGQDGAMCTVTAWKQGKQHKTSFASIRPQPWPSLEYNLDSVSVTLGEELLPLAPKISKDQGSMKPWSYSMACSLSGALSSSKFTYDPILSMGFIDGYQVLEIGEDGQIIVAPESALSAIFDALSVSGSARKAVTCHCRVFGIFPDPVISPVETTLTIHVQDTYCWVPQILKKSVAVVDSAATSESQCRARCRADATCANYKFADSTCSRYDARTDAFPSEFVGQDGGAGRCCRGATTSDNSMDYYDLTQATSLDDCKAKCLNNSKCVGIEFSADAPDQSGSCEVWTRPGGISASVGYSKCNCYRYGTTATVTAKVTNCTNEGTCMEVTHSKWFLSGVYCPLGRDAAAGRIVYMRQHVISEDTLYMHQAVSSSEGCPVGKWILQTASTSDFLDTTAGIFEFRGVIEACVDTPSFLVQPCSTKALAWMEEEETDEEGLPSLVLDDPSTTAAADFWLHPCDCAPSAWGTALPVNPESFEHMPAESGNNFIPAPFDIVTGQLVCPSRQLLPGGLGVHFQSEEEILEPADCESRCRNHDDCRFFWHGSQHGAATCRLFTGCDNLVREFSLEGSLKAMPRSTSCLVADAERCWATSLRRSFLTGGFSASTTSHGGGGGSSLHLPASPGDPPANGMVAWFKSENAGSVWLSSVGNIEAFSSKATTMRKVAAGYGADRPVTYIEGWTGTSFQFGQAGEVLKSTFTICSVTRYTGNTRLRILQTDKVNWLHGHWSGNTGVAFYQTWVTENEKNADTFDWVVLCGSNGQSSKVYELQGSPGSPANIAIRDGLSHPSDTTLGINAGYADEKSEFAVMEVITWDRALSDDEMKASMEYLKWKLRVGAVLEVSEHLPTELQKNFDSYGKQGLDDVASQTFEVPLANGYQADLSGWSHTREYARGFLRNMDGKATAVVKGLTPAAKYIFGIYMVHELEGWRGEAKISVNHGHNARVYQDALNIPRLSGVAQATPRGEINFEFERISPHIHLSGIAIAKVGAGSMATPADPPANGMVAWFKSENAGSVWLSSVGNIEAFSSKATTMRKVAAGYGADRPVTYIEGWTGTSFQFGQAGEVLKSTFTICSVTRYTGNTRLRILQTDKVNWLHGHWSGNTGVAFYQTWVTENEKNADTFDWVVLCGSNGQSSKVYELQGSPGSPANIAIRDGLSHPSDTTLGINAGYADEKSEFAVMEVITWDRALSDDEMKASMEYLKWKLRVGAVLEVSEHLPTELQKNFDSYGKQGLDDVASQTFEVPLANGYQADLSGWSYTREYARGFLRNMDGKATAVVKGLTPAAKYIFGIYMVHELEGWRGEAKISVNHGHNARVNQNELNIPVLSGVARATPRGEINFEFERISPHIHLSGIAIAKVGGVLALQELSELQLDVEFEQSFSEQSTTTFQGFLHLHLYQQCDTVLLLGGMGVQQCGRPGHRSVASHEWQHKRPLPKAFQSGTVLLASCWRERYRLLQGSQLMESERLQCVNGAWLNSLGETSLKGLACESCVQVGATGYAAFDLRNEQELYFFNRMALSLYTELGMIKELSSTAQHRYCLSKSSDGENMTVTASAGCPARLLAQVTAKSSPESRQFKLIPPDHTFSEEDQCLTSREATDQEVAGLQHMKCNVSAPKQLLLPAELPLDMWNLHIEADERTQDLHKGYSSYCGTSGALTTLDFGQLFVGEASDVSNPRSRCKFAPLIEFGEFKDTGIARQKTSNNWNSWHDLLADNPVECLEGEALTAFKLEAAQNKYRYECSKIGGLGSCFDYYSAQVEVPSFNQEKTHWAKPMRMLTASCGQNSVLGGFHFEFSEGGRWGRVRFQCCKAGGAPVSFDPRGQLPQLVSHFDGKFCPVGRDSGRPRYESNGQTLNFDRNAGKWCVGTACSDVTDVATPLGLVAAGWEVVNVSDFDGQFEGMMPKTGSAGLSLEDALKLKPPKRPKAPPMPELEEFKAEQPKYAAECLNYQNLWKKVTETFKDEEDNEVEKTEKLLAEPSTEGAELDNYHPCEVAKGAGGIFGAWGGGDGSTAPENMMYADWNDCMQGDIERDLASAKLDYHSALADFIMDMVEEGGGVICSVIPDVMIAPLGAGVALNPSSICNSALEFASAVKTFAGPGSAFHFARQGWAIEQEGYAACNPLQIGFARAFCDIHCVRDAVIRGDRSIIRNLELATKKTNNNMAALMKWSVESARTETGWLADKLDYSDAVNQAYLRSIHGLLAPDDAATQLRQGAEVATGIMLKEMAGYAEAASFNDLSRITAQDALSTYLSTPDLSGTSNATAVLAVLGHVDHLQQTLRRAARGHQKEEMLSRQLSKQVRQLQLQARQQLRTLGVYRLESDASTVRSRKARRHLISVSSQRREVMISMDRIWWQLRKKLDDYLSVAEEEMRSFQSSLEEMQNYMHCKKGFSSLIASYTTSMANLKRSHRHLRRAWREGSDLVGEMASIIVDADAFQIFAEEQGCKSSLMEQTLKQLESAIFGMAFLLHRFRAAQLPEPEAHGLTQATQRIQEAYVAATRHCNA